MRKEVRGGVRDAALVRDQYEAYWSEVLEHARRIVADEPRNLARALNLLTAAHALRPRKTRWLRGRRISAILADRTLPPRLAPSAISSIGRALVTNLVGQYCDSQTARIMELGSGWGANLFNLWLAGASRSAEYVALEYTETGREVTRLLGTTEPELRLNVQPFDYYKPDLSEFRSSDKTVVFTCHSIEQITHIDDRLFEELLAIPGLHRVVHLEPVGWQILAAGPIGPLVGFLSYVAPPRLSIEIDVRRRSRSSGYNRNLVERLRSLEGAGRIRIERIERNYFGANPLNPGTAIVWRRT